MSEIDTVGSCYYNGSFKNKRRLNIYCYYWKPESQPRALLFISHGYTEHSFVYDELAAKMTTKGFFVFAHDSEGHGKSEGTPALLSSFHHLVQDTVTHIRMIQQRFPDLPLFMFGHSMGGAVSILTSLENEVKVEGVVLIAPALAPPPKQVTFFKVAALRFISTFYPQYSLFPTNYSLSCRNKEKLREMNDDPLRYKKWLKAKSCLTFFFAFQEIQSRAHNMTVPFLLFHGDEDKVCDIKGSTDFFEKAPSTDKLFKVYPGSYHSLLYEPDGIGEEIADRAITWMCDRVRNE